MSGAIGEAFVRIRPDTARFENETATGIKAGLLGAAKVVGGLFAVGGALEAAKTVVRAAASEQSELASLRKSIQDTDQAWDQHGRNVGEILQKQARDAGFSFEEVARSFTRVEAGTQNTAKSLKILSLAEDVARGRHIELAQASLILSRVQQGSDTALRRLGIIIPKVTAAQDALKKEHNAGVAAGVKFTDQQKAQYQASLAQAKALDTQASRTRVLDEVQRRFGGQSATFAKSASGEFARLRENLRQFEAGLGAGALPELNRAAEGVIHLTENLRENEGITHTVTSAVNAFAAAVRAGASAVEFIAPGLRVLVDLVGKIGSFTGVGGIVALVAGFKSVGLTVDLVGAAQAKYQAILARGRGEQAATATGAEREAVAYNSLTVALERNTAALTANLAAGERGALGLSGGLGKVTRDASRSVGVIQGVGAALQSSAAAQIVSAEEIASSTTHAGDSLVSLLETSTTVADHSLSLADRFDRLGGAATRNASQLAGLTGEQIRYVAALEQTVGPERAAQIAVAGQASAYDALAVSAGAATAALAANTAANIAAAGSSAAGIANLATKEVQLANGAKIILPATTAAKLGLKDVGAAAETTGLRAAGLGGKLKTLGAGIFALAGGWVTVAAAAIAAVSVLIFKFVTADSALERANKRLGTSLEQLASDYAGVAKAAKAYADAQASIKTDKIAVAQAKLAEEQARTALATTTAKKGTVEYSQVLLQLQQAVDQYRQAIRQQAGDEHSAAQAQKARGKELAAAQADVRKSIQDTLNVVQHAEHDTTGFLGKVRDFFHQTAFGLPAANPLSSLLDAVGPKPGQLEGMNRFADSLHGQAKELKDAHPFFARQVEDMSLLTRALRVIPPQKLIKVFLQTGSARATVRELIVGLEQGDHKVGEFTTKIRTLGQALVNSDPKLSRQIRLVAELADALGRQPSQKVTNLILNAKDFKAGVSAALLELDRINGIKPGSKAATEFAAGFIAQLKQSGLVNSVKEALGAVTSSVAGVEQITKSQLEKAGAVAKQARTNVGAIATQLRDQTQTVIQAARTVSDSQRSLADAIRQGNQQIRDSVSSAAQNLFSIGSSLNSAIDQFLDAQQKAGTALTEGSPAAKEFKRLSEQLQKDGGPEIERHAHALEGRLEAESVAGAQSLDKRKEKVHQHVNDLVDAFNKGAITLAEFNRRLSKILAGEGITYRAAGRVLGLAFADGFNAVVKGLREQAAAIAAGPHFKGITGLEPEIIRPLEAVRDAQRQIRDAQRNLGDALKAQSTAQKELSSLQARAASLRQDLTRAQGKLETLQERFTKLLQKQAEIERLAEQQIGALQAGAIAGATGANKGAVTLGRDLGGGISKGLEQAKQQTSNAIVNLIEALIQAGRKKARAKSPSEETRELGLDIGTGLAAGISQSRPTTAKAAEDLVADTLHRARTAGLQAATVARQSALAAADPFNFNRSSSAPAPARETLQPFGTTRTDPAAILQAELLGESRTQTRLHRLQERHLGAVADETKKQTTELRRLGTKPSDHGGKKPRGSASRDARLAAGMF